ncbi:hypothetical protein [Arthrobacter globiformis]|uniref:hypothetical protein n=1 Tax=Arthrobacter globiformis TaxID=1665 RepID=UPI0027D86988|nr:hypothetical protein [Arthrobacter globiformis]
MSDDLLSDDPAGFCVGFFKGYLHLYMFPSLSVLIMIPSRGFGTLSIVNPDSPKYPSSLKLISP